jgi:hypothetical protein
MFHKQNSRGIPMMLKRLAACAFAMLLSFSVALAADEGITEKARKKGMKAAPELIQSLGIKCTLSDARLIENKTRSSFAGAALSVTNRSVGGGGPGGGGPPPGGGGGPPGGGGGGPDGGGDSGPPPGGGSMGGFNAKQYEVACTEGLGYVITDSVGKSPAEAVLCLEMDGAQPNGQGGPGGPPGGGPNGAPGGGPGGPEGGMGGGLPPGGPAGSASANCQLPGNANQAAGMIPFLLKAGIQQCTPSRVRGIGHSASRSFIEVACDDNASGYILATTLSPDVNKEVQASACADLAADSNIRCKLTDPNAALKVADDLVRQSDKACKVTDRRMFGTNDAGDKFYEVACAEGTGYIVQQTSEGKLGQMATCEEIGTMAGGCQLLGNKK